MTVTFDTETIRLITLFENLTGSTVKDCVVNKDNNTIYLVIDEGKVGMAIGKNGSSVKNAEKLTGKNIKIFEFSSDCNKFARELVPQANKIKIINGDDGKISIEIKIEKKNRALVIGRSGRNIKIFKELLQRNHNVSDVIVK